MTREEQIRKAAHSGDDNVHAEQYPIPGVADMFNGYFATCFELGAKWADQHPQWRPVDDELPEGGETVLANDGKRVVMATYQSGPDLWFRDVMFGCVAFNPTHWMPLPTSPATKGGAS